MASVRLTGWPALVVGIGVVAWAGWGFARHLQAVPAAAREAVRAWLAVDYAQPSAHHRLLGFNRGQSGSDGAMAFSLLPASGAAGDTADVTIESLDAHG